MHTTSDSIILALVLVVGISTVVAICVNRISSHLGSVLAKQSVTFQTSISETIPLPITSAGKPKRIVFQFKRSAGFYNGKIIVMSGSAEVGRYELPARSEYSNVTLKFYNEDISRESDTIIIGLRHHQIGLPLTVIVNLDQNVTDRVLRNKLDLPLNDEVSIVVRGRQENDIELKQNEKSVA